VLSQFEFKSFAYGLLIKVLVRQSDFGQFLDEPIANRTFEKIEDLEQVL
jgi:hypothetical protein